MTGSGTFLATNSSPIECSSAAPLGAAGRNALLGDLEARLQLLVLADELVAGLERDGLQERSEIHAEIGDGIGLQARRAEMGLDRLPRRRRDRECHAQLAAELETEIHILAQQRHGEGRRPVEVYQGRGLVAGEDR